MLNQDFKEFAALLGSNRVEYLIVGGYALAAYGHPRYTGDLDFNLIIEGDNFDSLRLLRVTPLQCPRRRTPIVKRL